MKFVGILVVLSLFAVANAGVLDLTESDFDSSVSAKDLTLVKFYAPWCGHCKALAPEYDSAGETLGDHEKIQLAKVDCTEEKDLCSKYGVRGYPTLKVFRGSPDEPGEYEGARKAGDIVSFMKKQALPAVSVVEDKAAIDELTKDDDISVVGFFDGEGDEYAAFTTVANKLRNDVLFVAVTSGAADVAKEYGASAPGVVALRNFDEPQVVYDGDATSSDDIESFIKTNSFPLFGEIGPENFQKYVGRGLPLVWFFLDPADSTTAGPATEVAKGFGDKFSFVNLDGVKWAQHGKSFGIRDELPGIVIEDRDGGFNYVFPEGDVTEASLKEWVEKFVSGDLQPTLKSEEPPADNDGPVTVVVGTTYEDIVLDSTKDVLLEFYAPWCGHCKSLAPKYDELGERFQDNPNIVIAKVDATENDTPIKVTGFPTLKFFPANDKSNPIAYSGDRETDAMEKFVRENSFTLKNGGGDDAAAEEHDL